MTNVAVESRWARRKLDRARHLLTELEAATSDWLEPAAHELDLVVAEEGRKVEAVLTFDIPPPLDDWSLIAGDCAHNIRSALDVFVWANSVLLDEHARRRVAYPILPLVDEDLDDDEPLPHRLENQTPSDRKWIERQVEGLPEPLRSRVIGNMRWSSTRYEGDLGWQQTLPLVRELDDIDKHRLALELESTWNTAFWDVRAVDDHGTAMKVAVAWSRGGVAQAVETGTAVMATGTSPVRIDRVLGSASVELGLRVRLFGRSLQLQHFLKMSIDHVGGLFDVLSEPG